MGRNKRSSVVLDNGTYTYGQSDPVPVAKKSKKMAAENENKLLKKKPTKKISAKEGTKVDSEVTPTVAAREVNKNSLHPYSDSTSSSDSESEKNSVPIEKKSEKSLSDSNSESDSDSESDSSTSDSTQQSVGETVKQQQNSGQRSSIPPKNVIVNPNPAKAADPTSKSSGTDSYHSDTEEEDKRRRKKQKEMLKMQLHKKTNKRNAPKKCESLDEPKVHDEDEVSSTDEIGWPEADIIELLHRMEDQIPEADEWKHDERAEKLNWTRISFGGHSREECFEVWNRISRRIRKYRNLSEMLSDAKQRASKFSCPDSNKGTDQKSSKALSMYMVYYLEHKDRVAKENPGMDMTQISKIISGMYKNLSDEERRKYKEKATSGRKNVESKSIDVGVTEMKKPAQQESSSKKTKVKEPRKPNPPFKMFLEAHIKKQALDGQDKKMVDESAKEMWKNLSDERKADWINSSLQDEARYEKEIRALKERNPDYVLPTNKSVLNKEERLIIERLSGKPVKPPNSAYSLFSKYKLQSDDEVKSKPPKQRMAEISRKWKEVSSAEKSKFEEKVKQLQKDYQAAYQMYLKSLSPQAREREIDLNKKQKRKKKETRETGDDNAKDKSTQRKGALKEPELPPVKAYDVFIKEFLASRPAGCSKSERLKEGEKHWEKLSHEEKVKYKTLVQKMKEKYIVDYELYLKKLSPAQLKRLSVKKAANKEKEEAGRKTNGTLTDSNDESEEEEAEEEAETATKNKVDGVSSSEDSESESESEKSNKGATESKTEDSTSEDSD